MANALSQKTCHSMSTTVMVESKILSDLRNISIEIVLLHESKAFLNSMSVKHTLVEDIKQAQVDGANKKEIKVNISKGKALGFVEDE